MNELTAEQLRNMLHYEPDTGAFSWKVDRSLVTLAGSVAGYLWTSRKYKNKCWRIKVYGKQYLASRLAWLYVYGKWPVDQVCHIDGDGLNNRIANLREGTTKEISQNAGMRCNNTSGFTGVTWNKKTVKWQAQINFNRKKHFLGFYEDPATAYRAYLKAKAELHTYQPTPREPAK